jgi:four helix bundle protein
VTSREAKRLPVVRSAIALCLRVREAPIEPKGNLKDQANRAAVSVVSNLLEGIGSGDLPRYVAIARGSAYELSGQLHIAGLAPLEQECDELCDELARIYGQPEPEILSGSVVVALVQESGE